MTFLIHEELCIAAAAEVPWNGVEEAVELDPEFNDGAAEVSSLLFVNPPAEVVLLVVPNPLEVLPFNGMDVDLIISSVDTESGLLCVCCCCCWERDLDRMSSID